VKKIPFVQLEAAITGSESAGFCLACGEETYGVEPDGRNYTCEYCDEKQVFGAEEIMTMGAFE
jgi:hypothetical protein